MCGPSSQEQSIAGQEQTFAQVLNNSFNQRFAGQDAVLTKLSNALTPTVAAGPNAQGFSPAELANRNAMAVNQTAANYNAAAHAVSGELAGRGGDSGLTSGVDQQIRGTIAAQGAQQLSNEEAGITAENYATGRDQYNRAVAGMQALQGDYNPQQFADLTGYAQGQAFNTANTIAQQKGQFWKTLAGVGLGIAGSFIPGGGTIGGLVKAGVGALSGGAKQPSGFNYVPQPSGGFGAGQLGDFSNISDANAPDYQPYQ